MNVSLYTNYIIAVIIVVASVIMAKLVYYVLRAFVLKITKKTKTSLDDKILKALEKPMFYAIILTGIYIGLKCVSIISSYESLIHTIFGLIGIGIGLWAVVGVINTFVAWYLEKQRLTRVQKTVFLSIRNIIDIIIYIIAFLFILHLFNIELTPILASLGIGGLAVALALQSTLSNYFAGLYMATDGSIKIGDYIELENGLKGYVEKIGWRSTKMRTLPNNLVIIPNSKLAESIITNYYDPTEEMSVVIPCGVAYDSDLEKVEKVTKDVAKKVLKNTEGGVKDFEPFIRYNKFGDSNIEFSIILRVKNFVSKYIITHEFIKELMKAYNKNKIEISWPVRKIYRGN